MWGAAPLAPLSAPRGPPLHPSLPAQSTPPGYDRPPRPACRRRSAPTRRGVCRRAQAESFRSKCADNAIEETVGTEEMTSRRLGSVALAVCRNLTRDGFVPKVPAGAVTEHHWVYAARRPATAVDRVAVVRSCRGHGRSGGTAWVAASGLAKPGALPMRPATCHGPPATTQMRRHTWIDDSEYLDGSSAAELHKIGREVSDTLQTYS